MEQRIVLSISQLNAEVGQLLSQGFPPLWVEGEISNLSRPASGHLYFSLKDADAQLRSAMFRNKAMATRLTLENGMKVLAHGRVGLYEPRGDYQFVVDQMEDAGEGQLRRQYEALKQALNEQGLFATEGKQALPVLPRRIGVITSPSGAAVRDILQVLRRRCPQIPVLIYPVAVQGDNAKEQIAQALWQANQQPRCDVLILARGGGSLEDLWPFNEEVVARALHASRIPVVSGVGHEIDFTIADFVADVRAPTPSAAAELVSPDSQALQLRLLRLQRQLVQQWQQGQYQRQQRLHMLQQRLSPQQPGRKLQQNAQRLDELDLRLRRLLTVQLMQQTQRLRHLQQRLEKQSPAQTLQRYRHAAQQQQQYLLRLMQLALDKQQKRLALQAARLHAYSPLATLERGFALVLDEQEQLVRDSAQVEAGQPVSVRLARGVLDCRVVSKRTV